MSGGRPDPVGDDRPSDAVLDELLRAFQADDLARGREIDLDSPEVEALLSGSYERPQRPEQGAELDDETGEGAAPDADAGDDASDALGGTDEADHAGDDAVDVPGHTDDTRHDPGDADAGRALAEADTVIPLDAARGGTADDDSGGSGSSSGAASTVVIADDGLPDAVYIEGDLDADGDAGKPRTVFIDDGADDIREIVGSAEAERITGIEPKLRQRRIAVQKAESRKRLRWVVAGAAVLIVIIAVLAVLGSSLFAIDKVRVEGATYSRDELGAVVDDLKGEPVLRVDTGKFEERIEEIPWVREARVTTKFPSSARIEIAEREPLATFQGADGKWRVIDIEGRVLDVVDGQPLEYLLVTTADPPNVAPGQTAPLGFANAGQLARYLTPTVRPMVEAIVTAADGTDTRLQLKNGTEVLLGDGQRLADKLVWLETVIRRSDGDLPAEVDVSTEEVTTG